ncbi:MAG: hypothetical protein ACXV8O_18075 [Methylobacter sp.]
MKLIESFQDLQNETCEIHADHLGNFYIGRRGSKMMNLSIHRLEEMLLACKKHLDNDSDV